MVYAACVLLHTNKKIYNAIVLPHLDYCSVVWQECSLELQRKLFLWYIDVSQEELLEAWARASEEMETWETGGVEAGTTFSCR